MSSYPSTPVPFTLEGQPLRGRAGDTLAAALLRNGVTTFTRSIKYHRPRGPFCLSGSCGQCLVRVDGVPSIPACRVPLREGMRCERQNAPTGVESDLFRAVDFLYPGGLDHHHLMVQSRLLGRVALEVARRLAGLGTLPDEVRPAIPGAVRQVAVAVIGAGPAGLAAARAALEAGARTLLLERDLEPGGAALLGIDPGAPGEGALRGEAEAISRAGGELWLGADVIGLYLQQGDAPALLAVRERSGKLTAIFAQRVVVATGGTPQPVPFGGNDRPGVYAARGLLGLARRTGLLVRPGKEEAGAPAPQLCLVGEGQELVDCARALVRAGYALARVVDAGDEPAPAAADVPVLRGQPVRVRGNPVRELQVQAGAALQKLRCDGVALAFPPAPLHELASSAGARAPYEHRSYGFPVEADKDGRTRVPWLFAAGRVRGAPGARASVSGLAAGRAAAQSLAAPPVSAEAPSPALPAPDSGPAAPEGA